MNSTEVKWWDIKMRIIHIGGAKTASTSLQRGIFQNLEDVISFGEFGDGFTSKEN